jgi:hypothetical protein
MILLITGFKSFANAKAVLKVECHNRTPIHVVTPRQGAEALFGIDPVLILVTDEAGYEMRVGANHTMREFREALRVTPNLAATPRVDV